jgi:hypothetical protein
MSELDHPSVHDMLGRLREEELARKARYQHAGRTGGSRAAAMREFLGRLPWVSASLRAIAHRPGKLTAPAAPRRSARRAGSFGKSS